MEYNARAESGGRQLDFTAQPRLDWEPAGLADRNRVQMTYVPASRDGVRQVDAFLGGRWRRASRWSDELRDHMNHAAEDMVEKFRAESVVSAIELTLAQRWQQLHHADTNAVPSFEPISDDARELFRNAELMFEPSDRVRAL